MFSRAYEDFTLFSAIKVDKVELMIRLQIVALPNYDTQNKIKFQIEAIKFIFGIWSKD